MLQKQEPTHVTGANTLLRHKTRQGRTLPHDLDCNLSQRHRSGASGSVVKRKEPGSPWKAWLVAGTPERRGNRHFYLLTHLVTHQRFALEQAVGGELAQKRAGSMLSVGKAPAHAGLRRAHLRLSAPAAAFEKAEKSP